MLKTYLEISLGMSAVILLILAVTPLLKKHYRASLRYALWIICAVVMLVPYRPVPKITIEVPKTEISENTVLTANNAVYDGFEVQGDVAEAEMPVESENNSAEKMFERVPNKSINWEMFFTMIWIFGAVIFMLYHISAYALFNRRVKPWCRKLEVSGYSGKPETVYCKIVKSPMLTGFFRPRILLPRCDYDKNELPMILNHELAHYKRGDLWIKLLFVTVNALHWFNPVVYVMRKAANRDMEYSCDEIVIKGKSKEFCRDYSMTVLNCAAGGMRTEFSTYFSEDKKNLKQRFGNILSGKKKRGIIIGVAVVALAVICAGVFGFGSKPETQENYLLLGTDGRNNIDMVMTGELKDGNLEVTVIPRDKVRRYLSSEMTTKSTKEIRDAIEVLTEKSLDKYAVIDINNAEKLLETIGSVSFWMPDLYNDGVGMAYDDPYQDLHISIPIGENMLNASKMMDVIRYRKNNADDSGQYNGYKNPDSYRASTTVNLLQEIVKQKTPYKDENDNIIRTAEMVCSAIETKNISLSDIEAVYKAVIKGKVNFNLFGNSEGFEKYEIYPGDNEEAAAEKLKGRYKKIYGEEENLYAGVGVNFCMPVPEDVKIEEYDLHGGAMNGVERLWNVTSPDGTMTIIVENKVIDLPGSEEVLKQRYYNTPWGEGEESPYQTGEYTVTDFQKFLFTVNQDTDENYMGYRYMINFSSDSAQYIVEAPIADTKTLRIVADIKSADKKQKMMELAKSVEVVKYGLG